VLATDAQGLPPGPDTLHAAQTWSKHIGRICGVKSTQWDNDSHAIYVIEFVGVASLIHVKPAWKCAQK